MKEQLAVPKAEFRSYYGRPILKKPAWDWKIAAYLFSGGVSAGSAMLGAGADLTDRPGLRRVSRIGSMVSILASLYFLIADLGRPERFHHMLRVAKPSSPMSMGTWMLSAYGPGAGVAGVAELMPPGLRKTWLGRLVERVGETGRTVGGGDGTGGGVVYGSSVVADGGSGVAGGPSVSAVRLHGIGGRERRRAGHAAGAGRRDGSGTADGGARRGARGGGVEGDGDSGWV